MFAGQDPSCVWVGWVTPDYHYYSNYFNLGKIRTTTVTLGDERGRVHERYSFKLLCCDWSVYMLIRLTQSLCFAVLKGVTATLCGEVMPLAPVTPPAGVMWIWRLVALLIWPLVCWPLQSMAESSQPHIRYCFLKSYFTLMAYTNVITFSYCTFKVYRI